MPGMKGKEFATLARQNFKTLAGEDKPETIFILYSAAGRLGLAEKLNMLQDQNGEVIFDNYIDKPGSDIEISDILEIYSFV